MMIRYGICCLLLLAAAGKPARGQTAAYPRDYFISPMGGAWNTVLLAGNFGECRPGHFHSGLDIKTDGVENKPVYAAAAGYISRISMKPGGFGHALYITHPNGYTTLYAHLNNFAPPVQAWVRDRQYATQSWTLDETLPPGKFPVTQRQLIAWSGNTGGSTAPHLHFEIRNTATERPLNPQLFGCTVRDTKPPVIYSVAVYDAQKSFYDAPPRMFKVTGKPGVYRTVPDTLAGPSEMPGIGVVTDDYMEGSENTLAFFKAEVYLDERLAQTIALDDIGYDETRYLNAYADYRMKHRGSPWIQLLYRLPGNRLTRIYSGDSETLKIPAGETRRLRIVLTDNNGNQSSIESWLRGGRRMEGVRCDRSQSIETPEVRYSLPPDALYDKVCTVHPEPRAAPASLSPLVKVGRAEVPVHTTFPLSLKPNKAIPFAQRTKVAMVRRDAKGESGRAARPEAGGWYTADVREFGDYRLVTDVTPPVIKLVSPPKPGAKEIRFTVADKTTGIKSFRAELDGQWLLFEQHGSSWFYIMDEHCPPGKHTLVVRATDELGNEAVQRISLIR